MCKELLQYTRKRVNHPCVAEINIIQFRHTTNSHKVKMLNQWRRLAAKVVGTDKTYKTNAAKLDKKLKKAAKRRSKQLDNILQSDWKSENSRIKLLLLGKLPKIKFCLKVDLLLFVQSS